MRISEVIAFLEEVKSWEGDIKFQSISGFHIRTIPSSGERVVIPVIDSGQMLVAIEPRESQFPQPTMVERLSG